MPHTTHRESKSEWNKKRVTHMSDGWAIVTSSHSKLPEQVLKDHAPNPKLIEPDVTEEVMTREYRSVKKKWDLTGSASQLHDMLKSKKFLQIRKAICFGLGSMCLAKNLRLQSMMQLAAFADMTSSLQSTDRPIHLYLQDPAFTPIDVRFLQSMQMHVINNDEGFSQITGNTLVLLPHMPWSVVLKQAENIAISPLVIMADPINLEVTMATLKESEGMHIGQIKRITSNREIVNFPVSRELHHEFEEFKICIVECADNDDS